MILLDTINKSLQIKLAAAVTTNQLPFSASYADNDTDTNVTTLGEQDGTSNGTTAVTVVSSPAASTDRLIKSIILRNADTAPAKVTVIYNNNSTLRNIIVVTLAVGDQLIYEDEKSWVCLDTNGNLKTTVSGGTISMPAETLFGNNTGTTADGTPLSVAEVLTMLGISSGGVIYNSIAGLLPTSISSSSNTSCTMTITAGQAADSTNSTMLSGGSFSWSVANGNAINGYQGGTTLPDSSAIHFFICSGTSGTGSFASTSLTPTLPSGYNTYYRRIFSFFTNSTGKLLGTVGSGGTALEISGGAMLFWVTTQVLDISTTSLGTSRTAYTLSGVPSGIKVQPLYRLNTNSTGVDFILTSGDETDVAPISSSGWTTAPGATYAGSSAVGVTPYPGDSLLTTNTSGQIGARCDSGSSNSLYWVTRGWIDFRRS